MDMAEIRGRFPMYKDLSDEQLAKGLYNKFYADKMPFEQFSEKIGLSLAPVDPYQGGVSGGKGASGGFTPPTATQKAVASAMPYVRPIAEGAGMVAGGMLAAPSAAVSGPVGPVAGAGLGYGMAKTGMDALEGWAKGSEPPTVAEAAKQAVTDVGQGMAMDAGGQLIAPVLGGMGAAARQVLGRTTGKGAEAIKLAAEGGDGFKAALRKQPGAGKEDILADVKDALYAVKDEMRQGYRTELQALEANQRPVDLTPLAQKVAKLKEAFGIKGSDLSRSGIDADQRVKIGKLLEEVETWGTKPGDNTVSGLDTLKKTLDDFYSESKRSGAFVSQLRNEVKDLIVQNYPRYAEMMKDYETHIKLVGEVEKGLSLGTRTAKETAINKLMGTLKNDKEYRRSLLDKLGAYAREDIPGRLAGASLSEWTPNISPAATLGLGTLGFGAHSMGMPLAYEAGLAALSSPRLVGEGAMAMGNLSRALPSQTPQAFMPGIAKYLQTKVLTGGEGS